VGCLIPGPFSPKPLLVGRSLDRRERHPHGVAAFLCSPDLSAQQVTRLPAWAQPVAKVDLAHADWRRMSMGLKVGGRGSHQELHNGV
jgi:hypothetical protein